MGFKATEEQKKIFHFIKNRKENLLIGALAGCGKCLGINTPILMYDGTIKTVQNICVGDLLMGDDSSPRKVLNTNKNNGDLYEIIPTKGDSWICNDVHVMTLHDEYKKKLIDIPLNEINEKKYPNGNYRRLRLQKTGVLFNNNHNIEIDPYLVGLWLGDGEKNNGSPRITVNKKENEIINYLNLIQYKNITPKITVDNRNENVLTFSLTTKNHVGGSNRNILREEFKTCINVHNEKFIPLKYLTSTFTNRLKLFAGLIDSDGYNHGNTYEIITKYNSLKNDILYLSRSLGYGSYSYIKKIKVNGEYKKYWRVSISGNLNEVPVLLKRKKIGERKQIKSPLRNSFKSNYIGNGDFYGFTLDGNGRFLLGDFTITHNTTTVVRGSELLPKDSKKIYLAFNKHIQMELKGKLPDDVYCMTFHGLGVQAIKNTYGDSIKFDEFKVDQIIKKKSTKWGLDKEFINYEDKQIYLAKIKKFVNLCRATVTLDKKYLPYLSTKFDIELDAPQDHKRVFSILEVMLNDRKTFDFTDMIFLPAIDNKIWTYQYDYVIVDECFPHNQYISTTVGKKKIGHLAKMFIDKIDLPNVQTFNEDLNIFEEKKIKKVWCNGEKETFKVVLGGKRNLISTNNHKYLTLQGWKRLDELKIGDAVLSNYSEQPYKKILNESQKNIFIGSILGDGSHINISKNISKISIIHGDKQKKYIEWKAKFFNKKIYEIEENGFSKKLAHAFSTNGSYFDDKYLNKKNIIKDITLKSLAISWMDDGTMNDSYNSSRLYSCATNNEHNEFLSKIIFKKWNIKSTPKRGLSSSTKKQYCWLLFNKENTEKLSKLISPFIHKSMDYKLCPNDRNNINENLWNCDNISYGCMIVTKEFKFHKKEKVYDMEVEDNHNFIITSSSKSNSNIAKDYGLIAHNCQDLNRAQQYIIKKILKKDRITKKTTGRLIAVGDNFQSIYGFSGVSDKSFEWFEKFPNIKKLPLTTTFRCAKNIVIEAQKIVPKLQALPNAIDGIVREGSVLDEPESGDFVLCRTTTPLIKLFFHYLLQGRKAMIKGSDIGISLNEMIQGHKTLSQLMAYWKNQEKDYEIKLRKRGILNFNDDAGYVALHDNVMALDFMSKLSTDVKDLKSKVSMIFSDELFGIVLSTVHKSKGLEADRVFIARPDKMPLPTKKAWQHQQEMNLKYVAITRAKHELIFDNEWNDDDQEGEIE